MPLTSRPVETYSMRQYPTAITPVLDCRKQEMDVLADPAVECVAILAEMFCFRVGNHIGVRKPASCQFFWLDA